MTSRATPDGSPEANGRVPFAALGRLSSPAVIVAGAVALYLVLAAMYYPFTIDDSFIGFRYAENWARGFGLVFNPGQPVEGYTNFLWIVILGIVSRAHIATIPASKVLGVAFGIGTLIVTYQMGRLITPTKAWIRYLAVTLLALYPGLAIWSVSGMETVLFAFLVTIGFWLSLLDRSPGALLFGAVFALATLTRPEGVLLFGLALVNGYIWVGSRRGTAGQRIGYLLSNLLPFVAIVGMWEIWRWSFYGYPLPNTFYFHAGDSAGLSITSGLWYVGLFFKSLGGWILLGLSLLIVLTPSRRHWKSLYLSVLICWIAYVGEIGGDWMPWFRFWIPVLPLILLAAQDFMSELSTAAPRLGNAFGAVLLLVGAGTAAYTVRAEAPILPGRQVIQTGPGPDAIRAGLWLRQNAAPQATVAVIAAGAIPYYSHLNAIDYYGIVNSTIAHMPVRSFTVDAGDGKTDHYRLRLDIDWLLDQRPTYFEIPGELMADGSLASAPPVAVVVFQSDRFKAEYGSEPVFVSGEEMLFERK